MVITAVIPEYSAGIGDGTDSEEEYVTPLHTSHLFWDCLTNGPGCSSPLKVKALIDCSSHIMIIDENLVNCLAICCHQLPMPLEVI